VLSEAVLQRFNILFYDYKQSIMLFKIDSNREHIKADECRRKSLFPY